MTRIFLETGKKSTSEYVFMRTLLGCMGYGDNKVEIICADGKDNLHNLANKMRETVLEGKGRNIIVFDADTEANGGGFLKRKGEIERQLAAMGVEADLFLFPNNADDGDFEALLEKLIQAGGTNCSSIATATTRDASATDISRQTGRDGCTHTSAPRKA